MTSRNKKDAESTEKLGVNTARLEALAAEAAQAKHWRARKSGMHDQGEPSYQVPLIRTHEPSRVVRST
jgi:hypothetical protein